MGILYSSPSQLQNRGGTSEQQVNHLINHYVRLHFTRLSNQHKTRYPVEINGMILKFLGNILSFRFNINMSTNPVTMKDLISKNGTVFSNESLDDLHNVACLPGRNSGIHDFNMRLKSAGADMIYLCLGITSDITNCCTSKSMSKFNNGYTYYVANFGKEGSAWSKTNKSETAPHFSCGGWRNDNMIRMQLNLESWTLKYYVDGWLIGTMDIEPNLECYICVSSYMIRSDAWQQFEIVEV